MSELIGYLSGEGQLVGELTIPKETGGGGSAELGPKTITANGTYLPSADSLDGYNRVNVSVPNSYTASDEGKVVASGALVGQTSRTVSANGTYDTTLNDEVTVNVPSGSPTLQSKTVNITPSETAQSRTVEPDYGYDGRDEVEVNVSAVSGTYVGSQVPRQSAAVITPSTSQQTAVAAGRYTEGAVVVDPIPSQYIVPTGTIEINQNGTGIDVSQYQYADVSVSGGSGFSNAKAGEVVIASEIASPSATQSFTLPGIQLDFVPDIFLLTMTKDTWESVKETAASHHIYYLLMMKPAFVPPARLGNTSTTDTSTAGIRVMCCNTAYNTQTAPDGYGISNIGSVNNDLLPYWGFNNDGTIFYGRISSSQQTKIYAGTYKYFAVKY